MTALDMVITTPTKNTGGIGRTETTINNVVSVRLRRTKKRKLACRWTDSSGNTVKEKFPAGTSVFIRETVL